MDASQLLIDRHPSLLRYRKFRRKACHIVKDNPANEGLIVEGWFNPAWQTDLPYTDCFLIINGRSICLTCYCILSMRDLWINKFNVEDAPDLYDKAGQILKFA